MAETTNDSTVSKYYKLSICGGLEALSAHHHKTSFPSHFHPTFNVTLVYRGSFRSQLQDRLVVAPPGSIVVTNPQEVHANPCQKDNALSFFTFYVNPEFLQSCHSKSSGLFQDKAIRDKALFFELHRLSLKLAKDSNTIVLEKDFTHQFTCLASRYFSDSGKPLPETGLLFSRLLSEDNFKKFSLSKTAMQFGMDKFKFIRLFKYYTGLTPNNYFIHRRIEKSKQLLTQGFDLLRVAIELGFYDSAHFSHHFKKFTGVTPMTYATGS